MLLVFEERLHTASDLVFAEDMARRVALALDNAALYRESELRRRRAEALADIGRILSRTLDVNIVAERVVQSARELIGAIAASVGALDAARNELTVLATAGEVGPGLRAHVRIPCDVGAIGLAVQERRPVATPNVLDDARLVLPSHSLERLVPAPFRSILATPLMVDGQVIGVLMIGDVAGRVFQPDEIELAQSFGDQAAIALRNARLHAEKLTLAHEDGRRRVAYDLHDGVAQLIVSAKQHLDTSRDVRETDRERADQELNTGIDRLDRAIAIVAFRQGLLH